MRSSRRLAALLLAGGLAGCGPVSRKTGILVPMAPPQHPIAQLEHALGSEDPAQRAQGAWELAGATGLGDETITRLKQLLGGDPDEKVRLAAAWAVGHVVPSSPENTEAHGYDEMPRALKQPRPTYPRDAAERRLEGVVVIDILINESGEIAHAEIPGLDTAALENVRTWTFAPARLQGKPVPAAAVAEVSFRLI
jgi:TonB family protein